MTDPDGGTCGLDYRVSPPVTNEALDVLFEAAWPDRARLDFGPILARSLAYVCAYEAGRLVDFVNLAWDGGIHAFLLDTTVHPDRRRRGIGRGLVGCAEALARDRGMEWLHVDFDPHLRDFYRACGFRPTDAGLIGFEPDCNRPIRPVGEEGSPDPGLISPATRPARGEHATKAGTTEHPPVPGDSPTSVHEGPPGPRQFSLRRLMLAIAVLALMIAPLAQFSRLLQLPPLRPGPPGGTAGPPRPAPAPSEPGRTPPPRDSGRTIESSGVEVIRLREENESLRREIEDLKRRAAGESPRRPR